MKSKCQKYLQGRKESATLVSEMQNETAEKKMTKEEQEAAGLLKADNTNTNYNITKHYVLSAESSVEEALMDMWRMTILDGDE